MPIMPQFQLPLSNVAGRGGAQLGLEQEKLRLAGAQALQQGLGQLSAGIFGDPRLKAQTQLQEQQGDIAAEGREQQFELDEQAAENKAQRDLDFTEKGIQEKMKFLIDNGIAANEQEAASLIASPLLRGAAETRRTQSEARKTEATEASETNRKNVENELAVSRARFAKLGFTPEDQELMLEAQRTKLKAGIAKDKGDIADEEVNDLLRSYRAANELTDLDPATKARMTEQKFRLGEATIAKIKAQAVAFGQRGSPGMTNTVLATLRRREEIFDAAIKKTESKRRVLNDRLKILLQQVADAEFDTKAKTKLGVDLRAVQTEIKALDIEEGQAHDERMKALADIQRLLEITARVNAGPIPTPSGLGEEKKSVAAGVAEGK